MTRNELRDKWTDLATTLRQFGPQGQGALCLQVLADLEEYWRGEDDARLTLAEAAATSGYSADHLRRLVRDNRLSAQRVGRRLFFRGGDLPKKPVPIDTQPDGPYDPIADARQVADRRNRGGNHGTQEVA